ncbi:Mu transposase C-terminal domain-containing protein [Pseudomonas putida]|uniref:Mu transposase C-terminal domain-containing protein n=1 Tax=Pseudomonas putida TaxID=303 RepID=UPI002363FA8A|nr:Mu transposase C-terminal domain-containing protein [Pseudomonas putida]MDD2067733.1 Mu transposase C-terminal domain-containing protein [Pseudomonas putida]HDS1738378.1 DDE-type integrase/transposase/recombinase [Pseudomonas putida]
MKDPPSTKNVGGQVTVIEPQQSPIPTPWVSSGLEYQPEYVIPFKEETASEQELQQAELRKKVLRDFVCNNIDREAAMKRIGVKRAQFYKLLAIYKSVHADEQSLGECADDTSYQLVGDSAPEFIRGKRGPVPGHVRAPPQILEVIQRAYDRRWNGPGASHADVCRYAQRFARKLGLDPPTKHIVTKFIKAKPLRERNLRKYAKERAHELHGTMSKKFHVEGLLSDVQMDHTEMDVFVVHHIHRKVILGRPWVTMIIDMATRVILGFYISLRHPNIQTVQNALVMAVLPKDEWMKWWGYEPSEHPFHGLFKCIRTDNALEFLSPELRNKCQDHWGISWVHRPKDKKWYGGTIERVIGTFMSNVRFVPGATGRNTGERKYLSSEQDATMDLVQLCDWFINEVIKYHGIKHRGLGCTPRQAWEHYAKEGVPVVPDEEVNKFRTDFLPSAYRCRIHPYGIAYNGRRYNSRDLDEYRGTRTDIRFDHNCLDYIWAKLDGVFVRVPCSYSRRSWPRIYEAYKADKTYKQHKFVPAVPAGEVDDPYADNALERQDRIVDAAVKQTADYEKGLRNGEVQIDSDMEPTPEIDHIPAVPEPKQTPAIPAPQTEVLVPRKIIDPLDYLL